MSLLLKSSLFGVGFATTGAGFVGSNYVFQKDKYVDLEQDKGDAKWEERLKLLLNSKLTVENLKIKINSSIEGNDNLAVDGENTAKKFTHQDKAKQALKAWCKKENKEQIEKEHENDLCKESKRVNWLFG